MWEVFEARLCRKQLKRCPKQILHQYEVWRELVKTSGPLALKKIRGYRDHALKGEWRGARSSYLTKQWRVIYVIEKDALQVMVMK